MLGVYDCESVMSIPAPSYCYMPGTNAPWKINNKSKQCKDILNQTNGRVLNEKLYTHESSEVNFFYICFVKISLHTSGKRYYTIIMIASIIVIMILIVMMIMMIMIVIVILLVSRF